MPTVLIIEDSKFLRMANERILAKAGYRVLGASDGEEGLRLAQEASPDLVLLDMMLPKLSGLEVLQSLKRSPATGSIPVVVLTSLSQKNEGKLRQVGAVGFLEKSALLDRPQPLLDMAALALQG